MGGAGIHKLGFGFVLFPVLANAVVMVTMAVLINGIFKWRRYPAILNRSGKMPSSVSAGLAMPEAAPSHEEVVAALRSLDSFVDISEDDLLRLVQILSSRPSQSQQDARV